MADHLEELGPLLAQRRASLGLSLREAAEASGVPMATLARIEQGRMPDLATFIRVVEWIGEPPGRFFARAPERAESTPEAIAENLRSDPALPPAAAQQIAGIVRDLYQNLASPQWRTAVHLRAAKTFLPPALRLLTDILDDMQTALDQQDSL
jgi:transcriptional regulator with XRE-family HTH domain